MGAVAVNLIANADPAIVIIREKRSGKQNLLFGAFDALYHRHDGPFVVVIEDKHFYYWRLGNIVIVQNFQRDAVCVNGFQNHFSHERDNLRFLGILAGGLLILY